MRMNEGLILLQKNFRQQNWRCPGKIIILFFLKTDELIIFLISNRFLFAIILDLF